MCQASRMSYPVAYHAAVAAIQSGMEPMRPFALRPASQHLAPIWLAPRQRRWSALLLTGLLLAGCGQDKSTPTVNVPAAQQAAGVPTAVVQANARQYRDAPALALVFSGPLAPKANWQGWLAVSEGGK
ncbi:hypothetical protein DBR19_06925, partial [Aeromonas sp. HMWF014]